MRFNATVVKVLLTIFLWSATIGISGSVSDDVRFFAPSWFDITPLVVLAVLGSIWATILIWGIPEFIKLYNYRVATQGDVSQSQGKAKRQGRDKLDLLMELMDEDEREAFKETLKRRVLEDMGVDDGELPYAAETLESLLEEEHSTRRL